MCSLSVHITVNRQHTVDIRSLLQQSSCLIKAAVGGGSESLPSRAFFVSGNMPQV
jgi:hypothetical protein